MNVKSALKGVILWCPKLGQVAIRGSRHTTTRMDALENNHIRLVSPNLYSRQGLLKSLIRGLGPFKRVLGEGLEVLDVFL